MSPTNPALAMFEDAPESLPTSDEIEELDDLLARAAELAASRGLEADAFVAAAWEACLDARPGLRAELAETELKAELRKLRKRGLVGLA